MKGYRISTTDVCASAIYGLINALFVYKYTARITSQPWAMSLLYLILIGLFIIFLYHITEFKFSSKAQNLIYLFMIVCVAILLTILMFQFDPGKIRVGRYPALYDWITELLNSEFPYASHTRPSGFPFLFIMAMPFYFLGDLGFFQIFSFLLFAFIVYLRHRMERENRFRVVFLLVTSPLFLYEIVVRSDLFSNMVVIMLYLAILEIYLPKMRGLALCLLGIMGGLLLSTRGIVLLIYIPVLAYLFRGQIVKGSYFFLSMLVGFSLTLIPFLIWDFDYFINFGPFSVQLSYVTSWLLILSIAVSVYCALTIRSLTRIISSISFVLFGVICVAFIMAVLGFGWFQTVLGDGFDISYFCFTLPFLLISLDLSEKRISPPNKVFAFQPDFVTKIQ